jgi:hypothetical protein
MSFGSPKAPQPTPAQKQLEKSQVINLAKLDAQENERRKRLLTAQTGVRAYRGSPLFRANMGDTAGTGASASSGAGYSGAVPNVRGLLGSIRMGPVF